MILTVKQTIHIAYQLCLHPCNCFLSLSSFTCLSPPLPHFDDISIFPLTFLSLRFRSAITYLFGHSNFLVEILTVIIWAFLFYFKGFIISDTISLSSTLNWVLLMPLFWSSCSCIFLDIYMWIDNSFRQVEKVDIWLNSGDGRSLEATNPLHVKKKSKTYKLLHTRSNTQFQFKLKLNYNRIKHLKCLSFF